MNEHTHRHIHTHKGFFVMTSGLWSGWFNNGCLQVKRLTIRSLFSPQDRMPQKLSLVLETWMLPRELVVYIRISKKWVLITAKECLSSRIDKVISDMRTKRKRTNDFFFFFSLCRLPPEGMDQKEPIIPYQIIQLRKSSKTFSAA